MTTEPVDLEAVRRRLERALDLMLDLVPFGVHDARKLHRAAYILAVNDVPQLLAEVERLRPVVEAAQAWYAHSTLSEPHEAALGAAVETYEAAGGEVR